MAQSPEQFPAGSPERYNLTRILDGDLPMAAVTRFVQVWQYSHDLDPDGKAGAATLGTVPVTDADAPPAPGSRPRNRSEVYAMYGDPGTGTADPDWERANIVECHTRGDRPRLPGVPEKWWVKLHRGAEPMFREALTRAAADGSYAIERIGGYVFRHQRHDPSRPLSYHSWGIAADIDAEQNSSKEFPDGAPEPWSAAWSAIWPDGLSRGFVAAFESVGFKWGGRWETFVDPMHLEWVG